MFEIDFFNDLLNGSIASFEHKERGGVYGPSIHRYTLNEEESKDGKPVYNREVRVPYDANDENFTHVFAMHKFRFEKTSGIIAMAMKNGPAGIIMAEPDVVKNWNWGDWDNVSNDFAITAKNGIIYQWYVINEYQYSPIAYKNVNDKWLFYHYLTDEEIAELLKFDDVVYAKDVNAWIDEFKITRK